MSFQDELEHFKQLEGVTTANKWFLPLVWAAKMISQVNAEKYKVTRIFSSSLGRGQIFNVDEQATEEGMIPAPAATAVMSEVSNHPSHQSPPISLFILGDFLTPMRWRCHPL